MYGYNPQEADELILKYYYDTVGDTKIELYKAEKCGPGVEYDNIFAD